MFYTGMTLLENGSMEDVIKEVQTKFFPTWRELGVYLYCTPASPLKPAQDEASFSSRYISETVRNIFKITSNFGETYMNSQKLLQGHSDTPLSEIGMEQARKLGRSLSSTTFTSAYSSDLQRAYNTAKLILGEITVSTPEIVQDRRLRERCYGDAEGRPAQEYAKRAAEAKVNVQNFVPNGGESIAELSQRVGDFFIALCKLSEISTSDEHVLVVSHGGWLNGLMRHLNEGTDNYELNNFSPSQAIRIHQNTGITVISITPLSSDSEQSKYKVDFRKINDVSHLAEETI